jgi:hypothetical protein
MISGRLSVGLAPVIAGLLAACTSAPQPGLGGMGLPQQRPDEVYPGARQEIVGVFDIAGDGCFHLLTKGKREFVIWPSGATQDGPIRIRLPDGSVIRDGDPVFGTGAYTPVAPLVADRNGYWATTIGFCASDADQVIVLDDAFKGAV